MVDSVGDDSTMFPPTKKRVASRQVSKDDDSDAEDESTVKEVGTFQKASDEVLASRRIIKVRGAAKPASSVPNPFAAIRLVAPPVPAGAHATPPALPPYSVAAVPSLVKVIDEENLTSLPAQVFLPTKEIKGGLSLKGCNAVESSDIVEALAGGDQETANEGVTEGGKDLTGSQKVEELKQGVENGDENEVDTKVDGKGTEEKLENTVEGHGAGQMPEDKDEGKVSELKQTGQSGSNSTIAFENLSSSKNAFAGAFGTGFSSSTFSVGTTEPSAGISGFASFGSGSAFAFKKASEGGHLPVFGTGNGSGSAFSFKAASEGGFSPGFGKINGSPFQVGFEANSINPVSSSAQQSSGCVSLQEVPVETGEEQEKVVFSAEATLFEYIEGGWKERGKGEVKVNVSDESGGRSRLLMRARGNYRLLLNASIFPDMKITSMDSRGLTFACANSAAEGKKGLTTYAVKLKDSMVAASFREAVDTHKGKPILDLKTPENSPTAHRESGRDM